MTNEEAIEYFENDIENALILGDKEEVKNYYERKAANEEE